MIGGLSVGGAGALFVKLLVPVGDSHMNVLLKCRLVVSIHLKMVGGWLFGLGGRGILKSGFLEGTGNELGNLRRRSGCLRMGWVGWTVLMGDELERLREWAEHIGLECFFYGPCRWG